VFDITVIPTFGRLPGVPIGPVPFGPKSTLRDEWESNLRAKVEERNRQLPPEQHIELKCEYPSIYIAKVHISVDEAMELLEIQRLSLFEPVAVASDDPE
jgi:hypothetical protein